MIDFGRARRERKEILYFGIFVVRCERGTVEVHTCAAQEKIGHFKTPVLTVPGVINSYWMRLSVISRFIQTEVKVICYYTITIETQK